MILVILVAHIGCIMHADDLFLLSASISGLQNMLNICYSYGLDDNITFSTKKYVFRKVGGDWLKPVNHVSLGNMTLEWVDSIEYLGIVFPAGSTLRVDTSYIRSNSILRAMAYSAIAAQLTNLSILVLSKLSVYHCSPTVLVPWICRPPVLES